MEGPAHVPDLNPIEKLWGDIKNAVSKANLKNSQQLWNVVCLSGAEISVSRCQRLRKVTQIKISSYKYFIFNILKNQKRTHTI